MKREWLDHKKILVLGASGLVGGELLKDLSVYPSVDLMATYYGQALSDQPNVGLVKVDLKDREALKDVIRGIDFVICCASETNRSPKNHEFVLNNVQMILNVLEVSAQMGVKKLVWMSSATAYPDFGRKMREEEMNEGPPHESSEIYAHSLRYLELMSEVYTRRTEGKLAITVLRPTAIYGLKSTLTADQGGHILSRLLLDVSKKVPEIEVWGTGEEERDYVHVQDVSQSALCALEKAQGFQVYNIGSGVTHSIKDILSLLLEDLKLSEETRICYKNIKQNKPSFIGVDISLAEKALAYVPEVTLAQGAREIVSEARSFLGR